MSTARSAARTSDIAATLKYFSLLYVFEQETRAYHAGRSQPGPTPSFAWLATCCLTGRTREIQFPLCCVFLEVFFVGINLARQLFVSKRLVEAAIVYRAVIGGNAFAKPRAWPDVDLHFLGGFCHESEFCLLVERVSDLVRARGRAR